MVKKYIGTGIVALGLVFSVGFAAPAQAASLTSAQVQAVISLLQSFGVDASTIANVNATLGGSSIPSSNASCLTLSYNLYAGLTDSSTSGQVSQLQQFLGVSSITGYFGPMTQQAVQNWQSAHGVVSSGSPDTTGYGFVGPATRVAMACSGSSNPSPTPSPISNQQPSATIDQSSLTSSSFHPVITGSASNVNSIAIGIKGYNGGSASVVNGRWSITIPDTLLTGTYALELVDNDNNQVLSLNNQLVVTSGYQEPVTVSATIDQGSLTTSSTYPIITGTASGVSSIYVSVSGNGQGGGSQGSVPVTNGRWSSGTIYAKASTNGFPTGTYSVSVYNGINGPVLTTGTLTITGTTNAQPNISVAQVSGLTVGLTYTNMPPAALKVFNDTSSTPIWTQELNGGGTTSGTTNVTLPSGTPSGKYIIEATDANGNNYAGTAWFNVTNTAAATIAITAASTAISPAMSMAVQYNNMPAAGVRIIDASGTTVWTQQLTSGGGGSTVVTLTSVLPTGNYTAQAYGTDSTVYATSAPYHFTAPDLTFAVSVGSPKTITLGMGQSASDGGIKITLASTATDSSGSAVANVNFAVSGAVPGFCSTGAGGYLCGGGGFGDPNSPTNAVTITVSSVSLQNNTATFIISTAQKG